MQSTQTITIWQKILQQPLPQLIPIKYITNTNLVLSRAFNCMLHYCLEMLSVSPQIKAVQGSPWRFSSERETGRPKCLGSVGQYFANTLWALLKTPKYVFNGLCVSRFKQLRCSASPPVALTPHITQVVLHELWTLCAVGVRNIHTIGQSISWQYKVESTLGHLGWSCNTVILHRRDIWAHRLLSALTVGKIRPMNFMESPVTVLLCSLMDTSHYMDLQDCSTCRFIDLCALPTLYTCVWCAWTPATRQWLPHIGTCTTVHCVCLSGPQMNASWASPPAAPKTIFVSAEMDISL